MTTTLQRLNRLMADRFGRRLMPTAALYPWQLNPQAVPSFHRGTLPEGAAEWLRPQNPRLVALRERYRAVDAAVTTPIGWDDQKVGEDDLLYFRGDNAYVWQVRGRNGNILSYALAYYAAKASDEEGLLERLGEDDLFGIHVFEIDGHSVSRDLIDSAREIRFLQRHAGLDDGPRNILDIGAGYGRLAHRLHQATDERTRIFAADAYAASTFLSEYYLRFRGAERASVVPLDEVEALFAGTRIDLAVNIHSFSECTPDAVAWWMEKLAGSGVGQLMIVPNTGAAGTAGRIENCRGLAPLFARFGYRQVACEPRYADPIVQDHYVDPAHLYLFELQ